jgi:hypothetical protein
MRPQSKTGNSAWRIFRKPLLIGVATVIGLVSALVGDGWYDVLSWVLLGGCVAVMIAAWCRARA